MDIANISFKHRVFIDNLVKTSLDTEGRVVMLDTGLANWELASAGMFGKKLAELDESQEAKLNKLSSKELADYAEKVRTTLGNPSKG